MTTYKEPHIIVLMTAYNGMEWIGKQVQSILEQSLVTVHLYISVDISTDGTYEWCKEIDGENAQVTVLPYGEKYGGAAPNFFRLMRDVDFSDADFVCFADQDDIWLNDKLSRAVDKIQTMKVQAYSSDVLAFWPSGKQQLIEKSQMQRKWDYLFEAAGPGCTYVFTNHLALSLQSFCKAHKDKLKNVILHDWFSYAYARANGYKWYIDDYVGLYYRQHIGNQVGANNGLAAFIYRFKAISSGEGIQQSILLAKCLKLEEVPFVKIWVSFRRWGFLRLAFRSYECRRKSTEQFLFFFACIVMAIVGAKLKNHSEAELFYQKQE